MNTTLSTLYSNINMWIQDAIAQGLGDTETAVTLRILGTYSFEGVQYNSTMDQGIIVSPTQPAEDPRYVVLWCDSARRKVFRIHPGNKLVEVLDLGRLFSDNQAGHGAAINEISH
jgi:hypothetical protein